MNKPSASYRAVIALESNVGDRFRNIEVALRLLEEPSYVFSSTGNAFPQTTQYVSVDVVNTSFMYETSPMYVTDQPAFINCACIVETSLEPLQLLELLKGIERLVGRVPTIRYGPRAVDLDIVFFDDVVVDTRSKEERNRLDNLVGQLVIPHPRLAEREFVLRPLNDMIPDYEHPITKELVSSLLKSLESKNTPDAQPMRKVVPFPRHLSQHTPPEESSASFPESIQAPPTLTYWTHPYRTSSARTPGRKTHIMGIINVTPDSFSHYDTIPMAITRASECVAEGATILDIGGYSVRPGAAFVDTEEEIARVKPAIDALRQAGSENSGKDKTGGLADVIISVDTFRPEVAEIAILSGANLINDVHAFMGPDWWKGGEFDQRVVEDADECLKKMKQLARRYAIPAILMHSRGDTASNHGYTQYSYAREAVVEGVRIELGEKVDRIVKGKGGLRRWMVIVDVGIGFSKTAEDDLEVLRSASKVTADCSIGPGLGERNPLAGYPQLIAPSRKYFLEALLEEGECGRKTQPTERVWATAASVACCVQQGALMVRVHDVQNMADVMHVSDAIWGAM